VSQRGDNVAKPFIQYKISQNVHWYLKKVNTRFPFLKYWLPTDLIIQLVILMSGSVVPAFIVWGMTSTWKFDRYAYTVMFLCFFLGVVMWIGAVGKVWMK